MSQPAPYEESLTVIGAGIILTAALAYLINQLPPIPADLPYRNEGIIVCVVLLVLVSILIAIWKKRPQVTRSVPRQPAPYGFTSITALPVASPAIQSVNSPHPTPQTQPVQTLKPQKLSLSWKPLITLGVLHFLPATVIGASLATEIGTSFTPSEALISFGITIVASIVLAWVRAGIRRLGEEQFRAWAIIFILFLLSGGPAFYFALLPGVILGLTWIMETYWSKIVTYFRPNIKLKDKPWHKWLIWIWATSLLFTGQYPPLFLGTWFFSAAAAEASATSALRSSIKQPQISNILISNVFWSTVVGEGVGASLKLIAVG